jgi:hypothetical protein
VPHFGHLTFVSFDIPAHPKEISATIANTRKMLNHFRSFITIVLSSLCPVYSVLRIKHNHLIDNFNLLSLQIRQWTSDLRHQTTLDRVLTLVFSCFFLLGLFPLFSASVSSLKSQVCGLLLSELQPFSINPWIHS